MKATKKSLVGPLSRLGFRNFAAEAAIAGQNLSEGFGVRLWGFGLGN